MTAEVAIANGYAVALAADSAVTVGGRKIYNSAVKLFSFSKVHPVGIMIYGSASLLDVPWETIIKTARNQLKATKFDSLEEYGAYFINFIQNHESYFSADSQQSWIKSRVGSCLGAIKENYVNLIRQDFERGIQIDNQRTIDVLEPLIDEAYESIKAYELAGDFTVTSEKVIRSVYRDLFKQLIAEVFENVPLTKKMSSRLLYLSAYLITRNFYSNNVSGIVIAGFGDSEIYPSLVTYEIDGFIKEGLKYRRLDRKSMKIKSGNECTIIPFAQEDMVYAFMRGMNPSVQNLFDSSLAQIFSRLPDLISDDDLTNNGRPADEIKADLKVRTDELLIKFKLQLEQHVNEIHVSPVLSMVSSLPKDELAAMAESLVNLTAFKRRMTENLETVGGPIDVAVISKGDGLVWVKRKLYFPKELNDHFFQNYYRGF
jgi:hypothetical protein